jgi:hypothetical protein
MTVIVMLFELDVHKPIRRIIHYIDVSHEMTKLKAASHEMLAHEPQSSGNEDQF